MTASKQAAKREQATSLCILDISKEGKRRRWREALPAKTAFETARELAKDGFTCTITRFELTKKQISRLEATYKAKIDASTPTWPKLPAVQRQPGESRRQPAAKNGR